MKKRMIGWWIRLNGVWECCGGYKALAWDHIRNEEIRKAATVQPITTHLIQKRLIIIIILFIYYMLFLQRQGAHSLLQAYDYKLCTETLLQKHWLQHIVAKTLLQLQITLVWTCQTRRDESHDKNSAGHGGRRCETERKTKTKIHGHHQKRHVEDINSFYCKDWRMAVSRTTHWCGYLEGSLMSALWL